MQKIGSEAVIFADVGLSAGAERVDIGHGQPIEIGNFQILPVLALIFRNRTETVDTEVGAVVAAIVIADGDFRIFVHGDGGQKLVAAYAAEIPGSGADGAKRFEGATEV